MVAGRAPLLIFGIGMDISLEHLPLGSLFRSYLIHETALSLESCLGAVVLKWKLTLKWVEGHWDILILVQRKECSNLYI